MIHPKCAQYVYDRIGSTEKEIVIPDNSGHVITVDSEWEHVAEQTYKFTQKNVTYE